jgi:amino acid transporter
MPRLSLRFLRRRASSAFGDFRLYFHSMPAQIQAATSRPELARDLGVSHAGAIVVGTIIGSGIFLVPAEMMQAVGSAKLVYLAWLVGGLLSFFGALTYAELGSMKPQAGGEYVYVRDGYGPLAGFLYAWTWFVIAKPASVATIATGLVRILGTFPIFFFFPTKAISVPFEGCNHSRHRSGLLQRRGERSRTRLGELCHHIHGS